MRALSSVATTRGLSVGYDAPNVSTTCVSRADACARSEYDDGPAVMSGVCTSAPSHCASVPAAPARPVKT